MVSHHMTWYEPEMIQILSHRLPQLQVLEYTLNIRTSKFTIVKERIEASSACIKILLHNALHNKSLFPLKTFCSHLLMANLERLHPQPMVCFPSRFVSLLSPHQYPYLSSNETANLQSETEANPRLNLYVTTLKLQW